MTLTAFCDKLAKRPRAGVCRFSGGGATEIKRVC